MTACWSEGELRAYLDRELPPDTLQQVALHLAECPECARVSGELETRAAFVSRVMQGLEAPSVRRPSHTRRWVAAALALAAGLAIAALLIPKRVEQPAAVPAPARTAATVASSPAESVAAVPAPETLQRPVRQTTSAGRRPRALDGFVRLDDEPFETGVVVRVALGPQQIPADVVFGTDGRARAIRLVNFK